MLVRIISPKYVPYIPISLFEIRLKYRRQSFVVAVMLMVTEDVIPEVAKVRYSTSRKY